MTVQGQSQIPTALRHPNEPEFVGDSALAGARSDRPSWSVAAPLVLLLAFVLAVTGCHKKKETQAKVPPPPAISSESVPNETSEQTTVEPLPKPKTEGWTEVGIASWYLPEPATRKTASGEPYDRLGLTAAHRTLPMNSIVRVTNLKTNVTAVVRINDRGPFIGERVIDLSLAAAKAVNVWGPGLAKVKLEVLHTPHPIESGGRWCVQIGAIRQRTDALVLKQNIANRFSTARVLDFSGSTGFWLRVRVPQDDRKRAQDVASSVKVREGGVYLVRLD